MCIRDSLFCGIAAPLGARAASGSAGGSGYPVAGFSKWWIGMDSVVGCMEAQRHGFVWSIQAVAAVIDSDSRNDLALGKCRLNIAHTTARHVAGVTPRGNRIHAVVDLRRNGGKGETGNRET